jgi:predicted aminopeptidase
VSTAQGTRPDSPEPSRAPSRRARIVRAALALVALTLLASCWACSPVYVVKAGLAEARILHARRPITEVITDSSTDAGTRGKLAFVLEAHRFAAADLGIDVGRAYSTYTKLEHDTLAMVLSAAYKDRLVPKTWWFPVVGSVPYKGYFNYGDARAARAKLEREGWDTYLRPTSAFSTLGWFNDPLLSTVLEDDDVGVVETVLHELAHTYLFVPGHVRFNESYADFVGYTGAAQFFCTREGGGPDTVKCHRAQARWRDLERFSVFIDGLVDQLEALYGRADLDHAAKISRREDIFRAAEERFTRDVQPTFESLSFQSFRTVPLNNATLLARMRYYHRLPAFQALLDEHGGDLRAVMEYLKAGVKKTKDPFSLLPTSGKLPGK